MVIFRENTEDIYAGIEFEAGTAERARSSSTSSSRISRSSFAKIRFPEEPRGIGIKPVSKEGTERLFRAAVQYAIANKRKSVTIVHKGNIMKFTEGAFRNWCYQLAEREFRSGVHLGAMGAHQAARGDKMPECADGRRRRPARSSSRTPSRTSRCSRCSRARRIRRDRHHEPERRLFVAMRSPRRWAASASRRAATSITSPATRCSRRRTAPRRNTRTSTRSIPARVILSGEMMLRYMGWTEAADAIIGAMDRTIAQKTVTYDFARLMQGATEVKCSEFGDI